MNSRAPQSEPNSDSPAFTQASDDAILRARIAELERENARLQRELDARGEPSDHRFETILLDNLEVAVIACDAGGNITHFNRAMRERHGLPKKSVPMNEWAKYHKLYLADGITPMPLDQVPLVRALRGERVRDWEFVIKPTGAPMRLLSVNAAPVLDANGQLLGAFSVAQDVSERRRNEDALRESEERFRLLAEATFEGIAITQNGRIVEANSLAASIFGYTRDELLGLGPAQLAAPQSRELVREMSSQNLTTPYEALCLRADGTTFLAEIRGRPINYAGQIARVTAFQDITERKRVEQALLESQRFAQSIVDNSTSLIYVFDLETRSLAYSNHDLSAFMGYNRDEIERIGADILDTVIHPDDRLALEQRVEQFQSCADGEVVEYEQRSRHADGTWHWVLHREVVFKRRENGRVWQLMGNAHDITHRKRDEEKLQRLLRELERSNEELQHFASVASHDLQEPLRKIQAFGDRLHSKYGAELPPQGQEYLEHMQDAARRMSTLIRDLLLFSRVSTQAKPPRAVDLTNIAQAVVNDLRARIDESGAQVEIGELPILEADASQMRQLLQNLIGNALKFHRSGEAPQVKVSAQVWPGDGRAQIEVSDNGIGFDEKYLDRIWTVFQRLHGRSAYEGTGIGLAIASKIVTRHGGTITARSTPGEGATFVVRLPLQQAAAEKGEVLVDEGV